MKQQPIRKKMVTYRVLDPEVVKVIFSAFVPTVIRDIGPPY